MTVEGWIVTSEDSEEDDEFWIRRGYSQAGARKLVRECEVNGFENIKIWHYVDGKLEEYAEPEPTYLLRYKWPEWDNPTILNYHRLSLKRRIEVDRHEWQQFDVFEVKGDDFRKLTAEEVDAL